MSRELTPWYVNGTLDATERAAVERALAETPESGAELALWTAVAKEIAQEEVSPNAGGVDMGWLRLQRQLNAAPARAPWRRWQLAAAAALVAMLGGETFYLAQLQGAHEEEIRQLGATPQGLRADEWRVQVRFRSNVTIEQVNTLLLDIDARVIEGPSALGIYELAVKHGARFADADAAARWLSEQPIVEQSAAPP
jgi:anti-sigma factor RsiW